MRLKSFLIILLITVPTLTAHAQNKPGFKEKGTATLFSILITGGGHFYSGETSKGLTLLGIGVGSYVVGAVLSDPGGDIKCSGFSCTVEDSNYTPLYLGAAVAVGAWVYGIMDSGKAVTRANERNGYTSVRLRIKEVNSSISPSRPGLSLSVTF